MRRFSSNDYKEYGRLLTPVVEGIRIRGPFKPAFMENVPRLVLMDGEGLGHTPQSAVHVSTRYTSRYPSSDVILLVDNAEQPMREASLSILRSLAISGLQESLLSVLPISIGSRVTIFLASPRNVTMSLPRSGWR